MSNDANATQGVSLVQKAIVLLGGIIAPIFVIYTITQSPDVATKAVEADRAAVIKNIAPLAQVELATVSDGPKVEKSGEEVVTQSCAACHGTGMMNSPKLGDASAWSARIAQGYETLTKNAIAGIRSMPARGGNADLTDNEMAKAVAYMANQAGANFTVEAVSVNSAPAEAAPVETVETAAPVEAVVEETSAPAEVASTEAPAVQTGKTGEEVVNTSCAMCHATGLMASPKIGDAGQWEPRIAQGYDVLVDHAINGVRTMPAKGGNAALSDEEVARAVAHMANQAGADFKAE